MPNTLTACKRVSCRDAGIANKPTPFGSFQRTVPENGTKIIFVEREQPIEFRCDEILARSELFFLGVRCVPIPGANVLANVAAENLPAHLPAKFLGNTPAVFNRQI